MAIEIERKFLIKNDSWKKDLVGQIYQQAYLSKSANKTVRIRIVEEKAFLTMKGKSKGISRTEFEYSIPVDDARIMINDLCDTPAILKQRYRVNFKGHSWEVDEFDQENDGLILAEIELNAEDEFFELPPWAGKEVSGDPKYYNSNLSKHPFTKW